MSFWAILCAALGGACLIEGLGWAIVPRLMKQAYQRLLAETNERDLHQGGLLSVALGVGLISCAVKFF